MKYRPDIDGIRAIAILSVLFFHGGFSAFGGGYVGVDVFFVISGYLITNIVLREVQGDQFSVLRFYERRVRRIFPALFVTLAITIGAGALLSVPSDLKDLAQSAVAVTLFFSNIFFWKDSGYFDGQSEHKPLLHTWSLAAEEQFYIAFPLFLVFIRRFFASRYILCLGLTAAASLGLSIYGTYAFPKATFYMAPTRAWEMLLGAILACGALSAPANGNLRNALAALGLTLIGVSVFLFTAETPFPGLASLLPTAGAAILIYTGSGQNTLVSRILSAKPVVFIGLISYSLYLLHWPLIVFTRELAIIEMTGFQMLMLLMLSVGLAAASYRFVESPFRSKQKVNRKALFSLAVAAMVCTVAVGQFIVVKKGLPQRFAAAFVESDNTNNWESCLGRSPTSERGLCKVGNPNANPSFLVWGDSHSLKLAPAIDRSAQANFSNGYLATKGGCPPLLDVKRDGYSCGKFDNETLMYIDHHPQLQTIILVARWSLYVSGRYKSEKGTPVVVRDASNALPADNDKSSIVEKGLTRSVRKILSMGRRVVLVGPIPEVGYEVPSAFAIAHITGRDVDALVAPTREEYKVRNHAIWGILHSLRELSGVQVLDLSENLCDVSKCRVTDSGHFLYSDTNHLSTYGAQRVSSSFDHLFHSQDSD